MLPCKSAIVRSAVSLGLVSVISPLAGTAQGSVNYGNFVGPNLTYLNVTETPTQLPPPTPTELFGPPILSGDALMFDPSNFSVASSGGGIEFQDGHLSMNIVPTTNKGYLTSISLTEGGGWTVGGGTSNTSAQETLIVNQMFITSVNGMSIAPIVVPAAITFTDTNSGTANVITSPDSITFNSSGGVSSGAWDGTAMFNLAGALTSAGMSGGHVTGLEVDLDDELSAVSESTSVAFIDKKFFNIDTTGTTVPEPATGSVLVLAVIGLLGRRSRR